MKRGRVILLAAVVVVTGTVVALQFRKSKQPLDQSSGWATTSSPAADTVATESVPPRALPHQPPAVADRSAGTDDDQTSPSMSSALAELDRKVFPLSDSSSKAASATKAAKTTISQPPQPAAATEPLVELNIREQTHRISDGDTLVRLAERYLGRAERSMELYEYNRDVLRSPDVLPIGADLRIPPQIPVQTIDPQTATKSTANTSLSVQSPLVPIQQEPPAGTPSGTPMNSAKPRIQQPRTYEVKVGDNLVDIARKVYGDGRRHEQLFEANRNVLKNPASLKPGMVLVVP